MRRVWPSSCRASDRSCGLSQRPCPLAAAATQLDVPCDRRVDRVETRSASVAGLLVAQARSRPRWPAQPNPKAPHVPATFDKPLSYAFAGPQTELEAVDRVRIAPGIASHTPSGGELKLAGPTPGSRHFVEIARRRQTWQRRPRHAGKHFICRRSSSRQPKTSRSVCRQRTARNGERLAHRSR